MREFAIAPTSTTGLALDTLPGCSNWRVSRWCPATNLIKNPSMKLGTTGYLARNPGGGNLLAITRGSVYAGTQAGYALSSGASLPGVTFDMAYMVTLSTKGKTYTLSIAVMPDVRQLMTLSVIAVAGTDRVIGTVTRDIVCGWERLEVVFPIPTDANFANIPISGLRFELTASINSPFKFDAAMLLDGVKRNHLYFDGDARGKWQGIAGNSYSDADESEPNGEMVNLRDLGLIVTGYAGLGLPASEHVGADSALSGGKTYDRTLQRARQFSVTGRIYSEGGSGDIQASRAKLIELFKPQSADRRARDVMIEYQPCDCDGAMCCARRIRAKFVNDGLAGNIDSAGSETVTLRFEEAAPPSVVEESGNSQALAFRQNFGMNHVLMNSKATGWTGPVISPEPVQVLDMAASETGAYIAMQVSSGPSLVHVDRNGVVSTPAGVTAALVRTAVSIAPNGDLWCSAFTAGARLSITTPSGTTNIAPGNTFDSYINKIIFHPNKNVYVFGAFTTPGNRVAVSTDLGASWSTLAGTGVNGNIEDAVLLPDGRIVLVGDFTQAGGMACKNAAIYSPFTHSFQAITTSADGRILTCAVGRDGRVYLGGEFIVLNGITCYGVASWNGTQVQPLGAGVRRTGALLSVNTMAVHPVTSELWVGGTFDTAGGIAVQRLAIWNGSTWVLQSVAFTVAVAFQSSVFSADGTYYAGSGALTSTAEGGGISSVCYKGTADERPVIYFVGPGRITNLRNITTGANIYMDYTMQNGEVCILDLRRNAKSIFYSRYYGNKPGAILRGSDVDRFALKASAKSETCKDCPNNQIELYIAGSNTTEGGATGITTAVMTWDNRHWGIDADCGTPVPRRNTPGSAGTPFANYKTIIGTLNTCNGGLSGLSILISDDQGNSQTVTTTAGGAFTVTLPFIAAETVVTATFNPYGDIQWGGRAYTSQLRVLLNDPSSLAFFSFDGTPCCTLTIRLLVTTTAGAPLISNAATVTLTSSGGGASIVFTKATDAPGVIIYSAVNPTLLPGTITASVAAPGYTTQSSTGVFTLCNRFDITINTFTVASTTFTGTLLDCNGNAVSGATIVISEASLLVPNQTVTTAANGAFSSTYGYVPGTYFATAVLFPGYTASGDVKSQIGFATPGTSIVFPPFGPSRPCTNSDTITLNGSLVDCNNLALQAKTITIRDSNGINRTATTNSLGAFTLSGAFPLGLIVASFSDPVNYQTGVSQTQISYTGGTGTYVFPAFTPLPCCAITVQGTIIDSTNQPIYGANINVTDANLTVWTAVTGPTGGWKITAPIWPGSYTATVNPGPGYTGSLSASGTLAYCSTNNIVFTGSVTPQVSTVSSQIVDCNGNDVAFATCTITDSAGRIYTATTNAIGLLFASHVYALGLITVSVTSPSYSNGPSIGTGTLGGYGGGVSISTFTPVPCATSSVIGFGLLGSGLRDKLKWPFSPTSIWNTPIGGGATMAAAGISFGVHTDPNGQNYQTRFIEEEELTFMDSTAPVTTVNYSPAAWSGGDRCVASGSAGGFPFTVRMLASYIVPNDGNNNSTAWIDSTGNTVIQAQPLARCTSGSSATAFVKFANESITGAGIAGAHGGSNLSALGGTIRYGEWTYAKNNNITYFRHALKMNMMAKKWYYWGGGGGNQYRWPASAADNYASAVTYAGVNSQLKPGSLLGLPSSFNVGALLTQPGRIIAETLKRFGAYLVDDTSWNACAVALEKGPAGNVKDEFQTLWGYSWRQQPDTTPQQTDWYKDWMTIVAALNVVTNNSASTIGGGGTPLYSTPVAPAIGN